MVLYFFFVADCLKVFFFFKYFGSHITSYLFPYVFRSLFLIIMVYILICWLWYYCCLIVYRYSAKYASISFFFVLFIVLVFGRCVWRCFSIVRGLLCVFVIFTIETTHNLLMCFCNISWIPIILFLFISGVCVVVFG